MFIILIAHTPGNFLTLWIPARFGFSDATEIFVFCPSMASAIAFGKALATRGWFLGTSRVAFRVWQQSLAVFVFSMVLARFIGFAFDQLGRGTWTVVLGNLIGVALITGVAYLAGWFKSQPWRAWPAK